MAFKWKDDGRIFQGEGVYHLTFTVVGRRPLLGRLVPLSESRWYKGDVERPVHTDGNCRLTSRLAMVELTDLGFAVSRHIVELETRVPGIRLCGKQLMPDHLHVVLWVTRDTGRSIRQIANGLRIGIKRLAIELAGWSETAGHLLDIPFIRTLSHRGQLRSMIDYVHSNPDNAWQRHLNPDLYVIRRSVMHGGLLFDTMGKSRLLDYPDRQVIALSRTLPAEMIQQQVQRALRRAAAGCVTLTAAINEGEKAVARAVREAGFPLVVMMLDGFPAEHTDAARYFHPSGIYHEACGQGKLYLMSPSPDNYRLPRLITLTDEELKRKAEAKHQTYIPLPHESKRWRMIAGNIMLNMI